MLCYGIEINSYHAVLKLVCCVHILIDKYRVSFLLLQALQRQQLRHKDYLESFKSMAIHLVQRPSNVPVQVLHIISSGFCYVPHDAVDHF